MDSKKQGKLRIDKKEWSCGNLPVQNISMATASIKEYGVKAKDSHWGYCVCVSRGFPERPWCGPWVWLALQSALITMFTGLPGTVALGLAVCTFIFRAFTIVFPLHDDIFLLTWAPAHPFGTIQTISHSHRPSFSPFHVPWNWFFSQASIKAYLYLLILPILLLCAKVGPASNCFFCQWNVIRQFQTGNTILPPVGDKANISGRRHRWAGSASPKEGGWGKERE